VKVKKTVLLLLSLLLLMSVTYNVASATNLTTEQKFNTLKEEQIFSGFADGSSRLYDSMSREQFATVLYRLLELSGSSSTKRFSDVSRTRWSYDAIRAVAKAGLMYGVSSTKFAPEQNVAVEQLAVILVRAMGYESGGGGFVYGTISPWARSSVKIALDKGLIHEMDDYTVNASRGVLVEAIYAIYLEINEQPIRVQTVQPLSNRVILLTLKQAVKDVSDNRFVIKDRYGRSMDVEVSSVSSDGKSIVLATEQLDNGVEYRLIIDGDEVRTFRAISDDQTKPQLQSVSSLNDRTVEVIFSEPVDEDSAENENNYRFNNSLRVQKADLTSDRKVILTTSDQQDGWSFELTVRNVKDKAGNAIDSVTRSFSSDYVKPTVTSVQVTNTAAVIVKFSEKVNTDDAVQTNRYSIDKGLSVTQAKLESDGRTVTLKTSAQKDGELYRLTVSNVRDLAGNRMDNSTNWKFGGVANPDVPVQFQWIKAVNNNTIEVGFNRAITDKDVTNLKLYVLKDNGSNVSMNEWSQFSMRKDNQSALVQFRTKGSSNPELFKPGHYYLARVSGVASLVTSNDADELEFAGTGTDNPIPYVKEIKAIDDDRVKVIFSEPVTNVDESAFNIKQLDGKFVEIDYDEWNNRDGIYTEVVLKLKKEMTPGWEYRVTFNWGVITDAAKWNNLKTQDGGDPYAIVFPARW